MIRPVQRLVAIVGAAGQGRGGRTRRFLLRTVRRVAGRS
jgi:hypothetical protein